MADFSFIIPFYKGERFLGRLLGTLAEVASLVRFELELILVLDSPESDESEVRDIVGGFRDSFIRVEIIRNATNLGVAVSRNAGMKISTGRWLCFIDQDDEAGPGLSYAMRRMVDEELDFLLMNGEARFLDGSYRNHRLFWCDPRLSLERLIRREVIRSPGQVIVRRSLIDSIGFPVPKIHAGADDRFCWILIFLAFPRLRYAYEPQLCYRALIHDSNAGNSVRNLWLSSLELLAELKTKTSDSEVHRYIHLNELLYQWKLGTWQNVSHYDKIMAGVEWMCFHLECNRLFAALVKRFRLPNVKALWRSPE